ncbi:LacI family DNA-binding transcriptional regulator [Streptomyces sp. NPDC096311]|uniref:LacI family DNA-binding transcriptional regulator n=1 Tax=Streptomyces sp. NPDC096311 TaxID=3366083 RepID=UPI003827951F
MPTLAQIARLAGVSVPTASRVANGRENVAPDTRVRVEEAMRRTGYVPRPRNDLSRTSPLVDVVVHRLGSSWSGELLRGAEEAAAERGLSIVVSGRLAEGPAGRPMGGWLDRLHARGTAGVLFSLGRLTATQYLWLARQRVPYVMVDPGVTPPTGVSTVSTTNGAGGRSATEHLLALGHRRIAVLGGRRHMLCSAARVEGYRAAMAAAGVQLPGGYVRFADFDAACAERLTYELLDMPEPPTAVFACSDEMAVAVIRAAARRGLRVPQDLSVVGFDDIPEAGWTIPELTTVRQPIADMAAHGMRTLMDMMLGESPDVTHAELPTRLIVRRSTAVAVLAAY